MINTEDITRTASTENSPLKAMRRNIERIANFSKKAVNESGSDTNSDSGADPDINISPKPFAKTEAEKALEEIAEPMSLDKAAKKSAEDWIKRITDDVRIKQQKKAVEEDESRFANLVEGLVVSTDSSDSNGPKLPGE